MVTEILGFLIIIGALLVVAVRYWSRHQSDSTRDGEELLSSTQQLKAELERSADAVVSRIGSHIQPLEDLVRRAEERTKHLERQLDEAHRMAGELQQRSDLLQRQLLDAQQVIQELSLRQSMTVVPASLPVMAPAARTSISAHPPVERVDAQDFAAVLQHSIARDEQGYAGALTAEQPLVSAQQAAGLAEAMTHRPEQASEPIAMAEPDDDNVPPNATKARALLLSGYSVEDTARETGIGRGAIELLQEMNWREMEQA